MVGPVMVAHIFQALEWRSNRSRSRAKMGTAETVLTVAVASKEPAMFKEVLDTLSPEQVRGANRVQIGTGRSRIQYC